MVTSLVLLHGRAGRLTAQNGGFRPGQMATEFVHFLQHNSPQLHFGSLTPAFMASKVNSPYDRTFLSTNEKEKENAMIRTKQRKAKANAKIEVRRIFVAALHPCTRASPASFHPGADPIGWARRSQSR
jgi:hypothetical protein